MNRAQHRGSNKRRWPVRRRHLPVIALACTLPLLATALVIVTSGAYAVFTSSLSAQSGVGAGEVNLTWSNSASSQLPFALDGLQPGTTLQLSADLVSAGSLAISAIQLDVAGTGTGTVSDGVQFAVDRCSTPWNVSGSTLTCAGTTTVITADRPVNAVLSLAGSAAFTVGGIDHLRFTFRLPTSSPVSAQNSSGSILLTAVGVQVASQQQ